MFKYLKQLAGESFIYGLSTVLIKFTGFFLIPIYTNHFPPEEFGVVNLVNSTYAIISILTALGLDSAAALYYYKLPDSQKDSPIANWFWTQAILTIFVGFFLFIFSGQFSMIIINDHRGDLAFKIIAIYLVTSIVPKILISFYRYQRKPIPATQYTIAYTLTTAMLTIFLISFVKTDINGIFWAQLFSSIFYAIIGIVVLRKHISFKLFNINLLRKMLRFAFPLIPAVISVWFLNSSSSFFINASLSTKEVGIYSIALAISSVILILTTAFQGALGPFVFSIYKENNAKSVYAQIFIAYIIICSIIHVLISLFAQEAIYFFTSPEYSTAENLVPILLFSYIATGLYYIASIGLNLAETNIPYAKGSTIGAAITILLFFFLIPLVGIIGAAIAMAIGQSLVPIYMFREAQKVYPIPYRFKKGIFILLSTLIVISLFWIFKVNLVVFETVNLFAVIIKLTLFAIYFISILFLFKKTLSIVTLRLFPSKVKAFFK